MEVINGYNHNIKYKEDIFHVQTEDSGMEKAHVITHLFIGGNIINTDKKSYADLLSEADWRDKVVSLMQSMHKNMMKGLIRGNFDDRIAQRSSGASFLNGPAPLNMDAGSQHRSSFGAQGATTAASTVTPGTAVIAAKAEAAIAPPVPTKLPKVSVPINSTPIRLKPITEPVAVAPVDTVNNTDPIMPFIPNSMPSTPAVAPIADVASSPKVSTKEYDGTFQVEGNLADLLLEAATTISSEDLEKALSSDDDSILFGGTEKKEDQGLDDMMMSFLGM